MVRPEQYTVQRFGRKVKLKPQQMIMFNALHEAWPELVSYDTLLCRIYDYGEKEPDSAMRCLHVIATQLRQAIRPLGLRIVSSSGFGFTLNKQWKARRPKHSGS